MRWEQAAELKGSGPNGYFGWSLAISGRTLVSGAHVFTNTATGWKQIVELRDPDAAASEDLGQAVAVTGTTAIVGAQEDANDTGRAYLFKV